MGRIVLAVSILCGVVAGLATLATIPPADAGPGPVMKFNAKGELLRPMGYREWIFIGAPVTPNDMNEGKAAFPEFHHVYIDRASYDYYTSTGKFREGTVIVKELASVGGKKAPSGNGYFPGKLDGIAASVKDSKRFGGDRDGWGYFDFGMDKQTAIVMPAAACNACHKASAAQELVFTQFYPVLEAAKPKPNKMHEGTPRHRGY